MLRETLCAWLQRRFAWIVPPDALVFAPGVVSAFNVACRAFCAPGDGVLVQAPVYPPMRTAPANFDLMRDEMELTRDSSGRYSVDYDRMEAAITDHTRLFMLCNPHNPTGRAFTREELLRMAEVSLRRGLTICSDEIHCDLVFEPHRHLPIASLDPEIARRTVTVMAPSKTFNIPGLGFAFAIIEDGGHAQSGSVRPAATSCPTSTCWDTPVHLPPTPRASHGWMRASPTCAGTVTFLMQFVAERLPGVRMALPEATYLAWLDFRAANLGEDPQRFFLRRAGVALNEAAGFGPGGEGFARLNFRLPAQHVVRGAGANGARAAIPVSAPFAGAWARVSGGARAACFDSGCATCYTRSCSGMRARRGGMAEWLMAAVLKTVVAKVTVGSNPSPSASSPACCRAHRGRSHSLVECARLLSGYR